MFTVKTANMIGFLGCGARRRGRNRTERSIPAERIPCHPGDRYWYYIRTTL
jgi:hypothetical protein